MVSQKVGFFIGNLRVFTCSKTDSKSIQSWVFATVVVQNLGVYKIPGGGYYVEMEQKKTRSHGHPRKSRRRGQKMTLIQNQLGAKNSVFGLLSQDVQIIEPRDFFAVKTAPHLAAICVIQAWIKHRPKFSVLKTFIAKFRRAAILQEPAQKPNCISGERSNWSMIHNWYRLRMRMAVLYCSDPAERAMKHGKRSLPDRSAGGG